MNYFVVGLGIILSNIFLKPVYKFLIYDFDIAIPNAYVNLTSEINTAICILSAYFYCRYHNLDRRIGNKYPMHRLLTIGVWIYTFKVAVFYVASTIQYAVYVLGSFQPMKWFTGSDISKFISLLLIFMGIFHALLSADKTPNKHKQSQPAAAGTVKR